MAKTQPAMTMRDALYEAPGPKTRRKMVVGTVISLAARGRASRFRGVPLLGDGAALLQVLGALQLEDHVGLPRPRPGGHLPGGPHRGRHLARAGHAPHAGAHQPREAPLAPLRHPHQLLPRRPEPAVYLRLLLRGAEPGLQDGLLLDAHHSHLACCLRRPRRGLPRRRQRRAAWPDRGGPVHRTLALEGSRPRSSCRRPSASSFRR